MEIKPADQAEDSRIATIRLKINAPNDHRNGRNVIVKIAFSSSTSKLYEEVAKMLGTVPGAIQLLKVLGGEVTPSNDTIEAEGLTPNSRLHCKLAV